ncbi:alpha/beta fold hydrolase [Paraferrimonas sedimenticola]|uniref:AB hydrolase-1 domain-containing protein n=1 Tax=Paraferrimonas sedimenticola TaxID=375674 RepID=A0AA37RWT1_9GAMM|nr:alpha/beta hydrolase [Paraferrimonas sedimenticola]GLP96374.1 hypothetical protein GCM10007895_16800 [Paraferrimonas sedimenticola]
MTLVSRRYLPSDSGQLHIFQCGDPRLPKCLLLHQAPSNGAMFKTLMPLLSKHFFCVAPDFPGFGQSDGRSDSISGLARELYESLTSAFGSFDLVFGHHTGAAVAIELALIQRLPPTLVMCGPPLLTEAQKAALPASIPVDIFDEQAPALDALWAKMRAKAPSVDIAISHRETLQAMALQNDYRAIYQAVADYPFAEACKAFDGETLLMAGSNDVLHGKMADTAKLLGKAEVHTLGDANTYACETHAEQMAALIVAFTNNNKG